MLLACEIEEVEGRAVLARRPPTTGGAAGTPEPGVCGTLCALDLRPVEFGEGEDGLLPFPGLLPGRNPLMAEAPKLMWRTNGVVGAVLVLAEVPSSSSMALSSIESELVDTLPRRRPKGTPELGVVPDSPRVVMDRRRRWPSFVGGGA